jgi:protein phosphatase 1 regulatory subunit 37
MTSAGAIALAEFLPESTSLLHLDLTMNSLNIAGVMALSSGLKANHVMRCLDVNIPPGDEEFARSVFFYSGFFLTKKAACIDLGECV